VVTLREEVLRARGFVFEQSLLRWLDDLWRARKHGHADGYDQYLDLALGLAGVFFPERFARRVGVDLGELLEETERELREAERQAQQLRAIKRGRFLRTEMAERRKAAADRLVHAIVNALYDLGLLIQRKEHEVGVGV